MAQDPQLATLWNLPPELHLELFSWFDPVTSICLGLTCSPFYRIHWNLHGTVDQEEYTQGRGDRFYGVEGTIFSFFRTGDTHLYPLIGSFMDKGGYTFDLMYMVFRPPALVGRPIRESDMLGLNRKSPRVVEKEGKDVDNRGRKGKDSWRVT